MFNPVEQVEGVGQNFGESRLELLLFRLAGPQIFAINVFKVREAVHCPEITEIPQAGHGVRGITYLRDDTISIIDLGQKMGQPPVTDTESAFLVVVELRGQVQGLLVSSVERIINIAWSDVHPAPKLNEADGYISSITRMEKELIEIVDVEKVLVEVFGEDNLVLSDAIQSHPEGEGNRIRKVLVVDDSKVARHQIVRTLEQIEVSSAVASDGVQALEQLQTWARSGDVSEQIAMIISDIEMPKMDGYGLVSEIRRDPKLKDLHILLHSSMTGILDQSLIEQAGADEYLEKFNVDNLARRVLAQVEPEFC